MWEIKMNLTYYLLIYLVNGRAMVIHVPFSRSWKLLKLLKMEHPLMLLKLLGMPA